MRFSRRSVFGLGGAAALTAVGGAVAAPYASAKTGDIKETYDRVTAEAGGDWWSYVTMVGANGQVETVVEDQMDQLVSIYSVNKIAVASAVWDKIERGELSLDQQLDLPGDLIENSEGLYYLQTVYGDQLTLANVMATMLLISDNTAVRMCGRVCSGPEINDFLARKGFMYTRVKPKADNPNRFYLGDSTPRETHRLLTMLVNNELVSKASTQFVLGVLTGISGVHNGIRATMSSEERSRVATKFGAFADGRHEAGIIFDTAGAPRLTYVICAKGQAGEDNFGQTHPAVAARTELGRVMLDAVDSLPVSTAETKAARIRPRVYRGSNGG